MSQSKRKPAPLIEITVAIPENLLRQVEKALDQKGSDLEALIRTSMRRYVRMPDLFYLDTPMSFGQYKDELIETLIRVETRYVLWCMENIHGFQLGGDAMALLDSLLPDEGLLVRRYAKEGTFDEVRVLPDRSSVCP